MFKNITISMLILGMVITSCTKNNALEIIQVNYGTSFGECIGYCKYDLNLEPGIATHVSSGWFDTIVKITCPETLADSSWNYFKGGIDVNSFFELSETIGCPDCADGGAEWIELELKDGERHKVTFEFHNEPSGLEEYVTRLRDMRNNVPQCD